jgi:1,4-alpha-glucan branching enzyme
MKARTPKPSKPSPTAGRKRVIFSVEADADSDVSVAGSFNGWLTLSLKPLSAKGVTPFSRVVFLPPGHYQYKFIIDGKWTTDPNNPACSMNELGTLNSLLQIG